MATDDLSPELLAAALEGDNALRDHAARIVNQMFVEIDRQMSSAPANVRHGLIQKVLPILVKIREADKANEELISLREEMDLLQADMAAQLLNGHQLVPDDDLADAPLPPADVA